MPIESKPIESKPSASRQIESVPMDPCSLNPELMLWVAGGNCSTNLCNRIRGNRNRGVESDLTLPYLLAQFAQFHDFEPKYML